MIKKYKLTIVGPKLSIQMPWKILIKEISEASIEGLGKSWNESFYQLVSKNLLSTLG